MKDRYGLWMAMWNTLLLFTGLKLCGKIAWSWWLVMSPLLMPVAGVLLAAIFKGLADVVRPTSAPMPMPTKDAFDSFDDAVASVPEDAPVCPVCKRPPVVSVDNVMCGQVGCPMQARPYSFKAWDKMARNLG